MSEKFRWLAGVIAAHADRRVESKQLQMTMLLLQECGLPTDYGYRTFFNGPHSEGLQADARLLEHLGLVEISRDHGDSPGPFWYVFTASSEAELPEIEPFKPRIELLQSADPDVLEVAATYAALRARGDNHEEALWRTEAKKPRQCEDGNLNSALDLLKKLGLPTTTEKAVKVS